MLLLFVVLLFLMSFAKSKEKISWKSVDVICVELLGIDPHQQNCSSHMIQEKRKTKDDGLKVIIDQ